MSNVSDRQEGEESGREGQALTTPAGKRLSVCPFLISVVCPNNTTFNQRLCFYVNLFKCFLCARWCKDEQEKDLSFGSSCYPGRKKFKYIDKPVLFLVDKG